VTVTAWRICKPRHAATAFSGDGAKLFGGRFNSKGVAVVYASGSVALAALEMLVHLQAADVLQSYSVRSVQFDGALVTNLDLNSLPKDWRDSPTPREVQRIGDEWVARSASVVLRVPSAVIPSEFNFLINPNHRDFRRLALGPEQPHRFDPRMIKVP
jgi:RES domain-containing protein